jgi:diguanylate cyclase (GGDEF)-like protein/PAS domain S-box-containing protein
MHLYAGKDCTANILTIDERLHRTLVSAGVLAWESDQQGDLTGLSPGPFRLSVTTADVSLFVWADLAHPDDVAWVRSELEKALRARTEFRIEYRVVSDGGGERRRLTAGAPRYSPSGDWLGYIGTTADIGRPGHSADRGRQELVDYKERLSGLLRLSSDWYWETDAAGKFTYLQEGAGNQPGLPLQSLLGRLRDESIRDRTQSGWIEYQRKVAGREPFRDLRFVAKWTRGEGQVFASVSGEPMFDNGVFKGYRGVTRDITKKMKLAAQIDALTEENTAIVEYSPDLIAVIDSDGCNVRVNRAFSTILGYAPDEVIGKGFLDFIVPNDRAAAERVLEEIRIRDTVVTEFENRCVRRDGSVAYLAWSAFFLKFHQNIYVIGRDVTERHMAKSQMELANARLTTMLENLGECFFSLDRDWRALYVNEKCATFIGQRREDCVGKLLWEIAPDIRDSSFFAGYQRAVETGETCIMQNYYAPARVWLEARAYPHADGLSVFFRDVSAERAAEEAYQRAHEIIEMTPAGYVLADAAACVADVNPALCRMLGYTREELLGRRLVTLLSGAAPDSARLTGGSTMLQREERIAHKHGHVVYLLVNVNITCDSAGKLVSVTAFMTDISQRKQAELALKNSEARMRAIFETAVDGIVITDEGGVVESFNPAAQRLFGYTEEEVRGKNVSLLMTTPHRERHDSDIARYAQTGDKYVIGIGREEVALRKDGTEFPVELSLAEMVDGERRMFTGIVRDITERKQAELRLERLALHDVLTGLPNRAFLGIRLREMLETAPREEANAIMLIDLDRFKEVNDSMGHQAGDLLLCEVGRRLQSAMRPSDIVVRLGGDEFVIVANCRNGIDTAPKIARKVLDLLTAPMTIDGQQVVVGGSIGISMFPRHGKTSEDLLQNADIAMYRAKEAGRSCYRMYSPEMGERAKARRRLETALRGALDERQFTLHYQPRVDVRTLDVVGVEALMRWTHPVLGCVPPDEFIPMAEEIGIIDAIGTWVLERAIEEILPLTVALGRSLQMAVNLSARQLKDVTLPARIQATLRQAGFPPQMLELELTETALIDDAGQTAALLEQLRQHGIVLSIDDFGTGHAGLSYLRDFDVNIVKLDKSFLLKTGRRSNSGAFLRAVIDLAHAMGLRVAAEGVETEEMLALLRQAGCDEAQGYLFARPMPIGELSRFLAFQTESRRRDGPDATTTA